MIVEAIKEMKKDIEQKTPKMFSYKEVLYFGIVTSIDALGSGVALHSGLSNNKTVWLHVCSKNIRIFLMIIMSNNDTVN